MNKTSLKFIIILVVTFIFLYGFSSSYSSNNITNISYVTAIGIDSADDKNHIRVSFEFIDTSQFSGQDSSEQSPPIIDTITASSISSAINILNSYIGREANLAHCKIVVFSEDVAKRGISAEITELMNNIQVRPSTNIIVSRSEAVKYMENTSSSLEKVLTKYYDIFPDSSEYTGYTSNITIGQFYNNLIDENCSNVAILGGVNLSSESTQKSSEDEQSGDSQGGSGGQSSEQQGGNGEQSNEQQGSNGEQSNEQKGDQGGNGKSNDVFVAGDAPIEGDRGAENMGIAVFKDDKFVTELNSQEALCYSLLMGEVDNFNLSIDNTEFYEYYIDLNLFHNTDNDISVKIVDDKPVIDIKIQLKGRILGTKDDSDVSNNLDLDKLSEASNKYIKKILIDYLNKTTTDIGCDINRFSYRAKCNFLTNQEWQDFDWQSKYKDATFNVDVDTSISYNLLGYDE